MKKFVKNILGLFFIFCIVFIPLSFGFEDFHRKMTQSIFHGLVAFLETIFYLKALKNIDFSSDTISLFLLILSLLAFSIILVFSLKLLKINCLSIFEFSKIIVVYYLAFILIKYGFDKIFKTQFYQPEPNILYCQFGDLSRDILYWSTIGTSRFYSISLGIIEVITAMSLLIKRTRIVGLLFAIMIFINVILVNFGFDISVKTFSILLLLMTIFAISSELKLIFDFIILKKQTKLVDSTFQVIKSKPLSNAVKTFVVFMIFIQVLLPYFEAQNFNDDVEPRPFLHGVYQVIETDQSVNEFKVNRFFIHRKNYIIFECLNGSKTDYYFTINKAKNQIIITDYKFVKKNISYRFSSNDSILELNFKNYKIIGKGQNWRKSNALKNDFHYFIDDIK